MKFYKFLICLFIIFLTRYSYSMDTIAKQAIMIDFDSSHIILEKNSDQLMKPASMAKLMTIYIVFEKTQILVSLQADICFLF